MIWRRDLCKCVEQIEPCIWLSLGTWFWNVHRSSYRVYAETALIHFQDGGGVVGVTNPACLSPGFVLQKCKRDPIPPSRAKNWQQKSANPTYVPGVTRVYDRSIVCVFTKPTRNELIMHDIPLAT